jgi:hypothetical protein
MRIYRYDKYDKERVKKRIESTLFEMNNATTKEAIDVLEELLEKYKEVYYGKKRDDKSANAITRPVTTARTKKSKPKPNVRLHKKSKRSRV